MTFGERIRQLREERGYKKTELAERAHIDPTYVGKIERGDRTAIDPQILDAICTALEYPLIDLFRDVGLGQQAGAGDLPRWATDVIRALDSLPEELREAHVETLLRLEEQEKRHREAPARKGRQHRQDQRAEVGEQATAKL